MWVRGSSLRATLYISCDSQGFLSVISSLPKLDFKVGRQVLAMCILSGLCRMKEPLFSRLVQMRLYPLILPELFHQG